MTVNWQLIGQRIRHKRQKLKLTQENLAEMADTSNIYICRIETGSACPTLQMILAICEALGCSISYLVEGKEQVKYNTHAGEIFSMLDGVSPYKVKFVNQIVKSILETDIPY